MNSQTCTLHEAAETLDLHYMTIYRYVRTGMLLASKKNGTWVIEKKELEKLKNKAPAAVGRGNRDLSKRIEPLMNCLINGDQEGVWKIAESVRAAGCDVEDFCIDLLFPAMGSIGRGWADGTFSIAAEHRASAIVPSLLGRLQATSAVRGRKRGLIIVGCPPAEEHGLVTSVLALLLKGRKFDVQDLGSNTPPASFVEVCLDADRLVAVALSVSTPGSLEGLRDVTESLRREKINVPLVVGGTGLFGLTPESVGADHIMSDFRLGLELIERLADG